MLVYCISVWYPGSSAADREALQWVFSTAQKVIVCSLPSVEDPLISRCLSRAANILKDSSHPVDIICSSCCRLADATGPAHPKQNGTAFTPGSYVYWTMPLDALITLISCPTYKSSSFIYFCLKCKQNLLYNDKRNLNYESNLYRSDDYVDGFRSSLHGDKINQINLLLLVLLHCWGRFSFTSKDLMQPTSETPVKTVLPGCVFQ